ncbi:hypothetical protein [Nocardioides sp. B-3]|uniref:hypothetical protein n=1 Tax=Nocardioides sp. B-3 TaxID=2895565 RepID=UPI002152505F|nr:hypothetical protein [Nocardioides sp. B-3]UUZ60208.1 hypothetical protein LP418_04515 [Nocardioides sp. B-3]
MGNRGWTRRITLRDVSMLCVVAIGVCSFVLLTGSAQSARLEVTRTVDANYRSSYDIPVRPQGSQTAIEAAQGTVRPNYLSGIYGSISSKEVAQIRKIPGVEIAAPIAMVGQVIQNVWVPIDVTPDVDPVGESLFRFSSVGSNSAGLNQFTGPQGYTYVADGLSQDFGAGSEIPVTQRIRGENVPVCRGDPVRRVGPFSEDARWFPQCWDRESGLAGSVWPEGRSKFVVRLPIRFPVTVAAIDPEAEAALTGLDDAIVRGSYLTDESGPEPDDTGMSGPTIPVLYSTQSYVREVMQVRWTHSDDARSSN